jgi:16S rRNA (cytosine1402-N4)-methyltransferase
MRMNSNHYHTSVLLHTSVDGLEIKPNGVYVDVTFGGGGHSREILKQLGPNGKLIAFDRDKDAHQNAIADQRFTLMHSNYRFLKNFVMLAGLNEVDGILADLGVSSYQFDTAERGFSIRFESELDMRMDQTQKLTAKEVINEFTEQQLTQIFRLYGEIDNAPRVARLIATERKKEAINTTEQLKLVLQPMVYKPREQKFFAQVFQALRIEVNGELDSLKEFLIQSLEILKPGGRLVIISYHSLEDRLVKNFIRSGKFSGEAEKDFYGNSLSPFKLITRKAIVPEEEEIELNNRARSAKLRIAEKI